MSKALSRRHLRFNSFEHALERLEEACERDAYDHLERAGLIKTFGICFELAWKVLKDFLSHDGYHTRTPRAVVRTSFDAGYLAEHECEAMLRALDNRYLLGHAYSAQAALQAEELIKEVFYQTLCRIHTTLGTGPANE